MTANDHGKIGRNRMLNLRGWIVGLAALIFLAIATVYAFSTIFSYFAFYDDEGFMMISVRGYLDGHRLYDDIFTYYGPFYYLYEWFVHALTSLPLSHDFTRCLCIFHWLVAASVLALAGGLMTRSVPVAFLIFAQAILHLTPLVREPGHPQELAAVLLTVAVLVAQRGLQWRWTLPLLGAIGAALVFTKINVGVFFVFGLMLALSCQKPMFQSRRAWFWGLLALVSLVPCLLMRPHLGEAWARVYCGQACATILAAGAVAHIFAGERQLGLNQVFQAGVAFTGLSATFIAVLLITGTSMSSIVQSLVTGPSRLGNVFYIPLKVPYCSWSGAAALLGAAAVVTWRRRLDRLQPVMAAAKGLYGLLGTLLLLSDYYMQLGYLWPWSWLLLVRIRTGQPGETPNTFARTFLCLQAAWQGLQAYPTAGTQAVIGTLLMVLVYSVCLHDAIMAFIVAPWAVRHPRNVTPRTAAFSKTLVLAGLLYLFVIHWCNPLSSWHYYSSVPPLGLRGARYLRLPAEQVDTYRALAQYIETECDTFITLPGLNSLYFWTGKTPPTYFNVSEVVLQTEQQQAQIVAALQKARHPLIVVNEARAFYSAGVGPLGRLISQQCREVKRIGSFRILELQSAVVRQPSL